MEWGLCHGHCYCALGIHVDESGSPEERQSGDGTSFPESPDLSHVRTTAAFQQRANQRVGHLMLIVLCLLSDITSFWRSAHMFDSSTCSHRSGHDGSKLELFEAADFQSRCYAAVVLLTSWSCHSPCRLQECTRSWRTCTQERAHRHCRVAPQQSQRSGDRPKPTGAVSPPSPSPLSQVHKPWFLHLVCNHADKVSSDAMFVSNPSNLQFEIHSSLLA